MCRKGICFESFYLSSSKIQDLFSDVSNFGFTRFAASQVLWSKGAGMKFSMVSPRVRAYPGRLPYFRAPVEHARWILGSKKEAGPSLKVLDSWVF